MMDKLKLAIAILLVAGGIVGFYWYADQVALLYRVLGLLAVFGVAIGIAVTSELGQQVVAFGRSASMEMRKTVWPTRKETTQTTIIVVVFVSILGLIIFFIDSVLHWVVTKLI